LATRAEDSDQIDAVELIGCCQVCLERKHFTLIGLDEPEKIGARVGFEAVNELVRSEILYLAEILLNPKKQKVTNVQQLDFDSIIKSVEKIRKAGYTATVLMVPSQRNQFCLE